MKGFKNSTRMQYITGPSHGEERGAAKVAKTMSNFKKPMKKAAGGAVTDRGAMMKMRDAMKMRGASPKGREMKKNMDDAAMAGAGGALGAVTDRERKMMAVKRKGVPAYRDTPMVKK
jgi:hypothetical protein